MSIAFVVSMVFGLAALAAIGAAARGKRTWSDPECRECGHDLRGFGAQAMHCPSCGVILGRRRGVRYCERRRRAGPFLLALFLFIAAVGAWRELPGNVRAVPPPATRPAPRQNPMAIDPALTTAELTALASDRGWTAEFWEETARRVRGDELQADELGDLLVAARRRLVPHEDAWTLVLDALATKRLSYSAFEAICERLYGDPPSVEIISEGARPPSIRVSQRAGWPRLRRAVIHSIEIDGRDVGHGRHPTAMGSSWRISWSLSRVTAGHHEARVDVEWGIAGADAIGGQAPPDLWSKRETLVAPFVID